MDDAFCPSCNCDRCKRREGPCGHGEHCSRCRKTRSACCCDQACPRCRKPQWQCCCKEVCTLCGQPALICCCVQKRPPACACPPAPMCNAAPASFRGGYLLPRILACGREWVRCMDATIQVRGLPEALAQPLTICQICVANVPPRWQEDDACRNEPRAVILLVEIPLEVTLRDADGSFHQGRSEVFVRVRVPLSCPRDQCWQNRWEVLPSVRMLGCAAQECEQMFCVRLEANVEAYMVRSEPVCRRECPPQCPPPLPLYPQLPRIKGGCDC